MKPPLRIFIPALVLSCAQGASLSPISVRGPGQVPPITASGASGAAEFGSDRDTVFFLSDASDLVTEPGQPGNLDLYRHDLSSGTRTRVSLLSPDGGGTGDVRSFSIASDGSRVVFTRMATTPDGWSREDLFVRDLPSGAARWVRLSPPEVPEPAGIFSTAALSGDGQWVVFDSLATSIVNDPDGNLAPDVFRRNLSTGVTELLSRTPTGEAGNRGSMEPLVSPDGATVVFLSDATDIAPLSGYATALIVWREGQIPRRISLPGIPATPLVAPIVPSDVTLSANGRFLAFSVVGWNPAQVNRAWWCELDGDRCLAASDTFPVTGDPLSLSADGRTLALTVSIGTGLTATNQVRVWSEAGVTEPGTSRVYHRLLATGETRILSEDATLPGPAFSPDSSRVALQIQDPVVTPGDDNRSFDVVTITLSDFQRQVVSTAGPAGRRTASGNSLSATGLSDDGRFTVFTSAAPDIVAGGGGEVYSGFVFDRLSGTNRQVGRTPGSSAPTRSVRGVQLARSGQQVVYLSDEADLTPGDTNTLTDAFVQDLATGAITLASARDRSDESLSGLTSEARISADGRRVAFLNDVDLGAGARPGRNLFLRDLEGRRTYWVNDPTRIDGNITIHPIAGFELSADGSTIAFLISGPSSSVVVHRHDWPRLRRTIQAVGSFVLSADGHHVFATRTTAAGIELHHHRLATEESRLLATLPPGAVADLQCSTDGAVATFCHRPAGVPLSPWQVWSLTVTDPTPRLESSTPNGGPGNDDSRGPQLSADGRQLVFRSDASDLLSEDGNGAGDIFVRDRYTGMLTLLSQTPTGRSGNSTSTRPQISGDGRFASFTTYANDLVAGDANDASDVILATLDTAAPADSDADGLPDRWELDHLGTLQHHGSDDPDLDLQSNREEWAARTDPSDAASRLTVSGITWATGAPRIDRSGHSGVRYQLERRPDLTSPADWVPTGETLIGFEGPQSSVLSEPSATGFYRLRVLPVP